jgi:hypothetical protein
MQKRCFAEGHVSNVVTEFNYFSITALSKIVVDIFQFRVPHFYVTKKSLKITTYNVIFIKMKKGSHDGSGNFIFHLFISQIDILLRCMKFL